MACAFVKKLPSANRFEMMTDEFQYLLCKHIAKCIHCNLQWMIIGRKKYNKLSKTKYYQHWIIYMFINPIMRNKLMNKRKAFLSQFRMCGITLFKVPMTLVKCYNSF